MGFKIEHVGESTDEQKFTVDGTRAAAYAAATNDPIEAHRSGTIAPPVFGVVPIWESIGAVVGLVTPPEVMLNVLHGEQDMHFHQPITPGMTLISKGTPVGVHVKKSGTTVVSKLESRDAATGDLVTEQYSVTFFRGASDGESRGEEAPAHRFPDEVRANDPVAVVEQTMDTDQTYRYSDASGDMVPIHLDEGIAKSVGLPGIIIHGLCTMAMCGQAVLQAAGGAHPSEVRRLAVRFTRPVLPASQLVVSVFEPVPANGTGRRFAFEAKSRAKVVVKDGLAVLGPPR